MLRSYILSTQPLLVYGIFTTVLSMCIFQGRVHGNEWAGKEIKQTISVDDKSFIDIIQTSGSAEVVGWDKNEVSISGVLGDRTEYFLFKRQGNTVLIHVKDEKYSNKNGWSEGFKGKATQLLIKVPDTSPIEYKSSNADLDISSVRGGVEIEVVNGDIDAQNIQGRTEVTTVNGDVDIEHQSGALIMSSVNGDIDATHEDGESLSAKTVNGDITIDSQAKQGILETVNGDIDVELTEVIELISSSVNGDLELVFGEIEGASIEATSVGGDIELMFENDVEAKFSIVVHTGGGSITNNLTDHTPKKVKFVPGASLTFSTGEPLSKVDVSTVSGSIKIDSQ